MFSNMSPAMKAVLTGVAIFIAGTLGRFIAAQSQGVPFTPALTFDLSVALIVGFVSYLVYNGKK